MSGWWSFCSASLATSLTNFMAGGEVVELEDLLDGIAFSLPVAELVESLFDLFVVEQIAH